MPILQRRGIGERRQPEWWRGSGRFGRLGFRWDDHSSRERWDDEPIQFWWRGFRGKQERRFDGIGQQRRRKPGLWRIGLRRGYRFGRCHWRLHIGWR
jgi:hypothetical protein